MQPTLFLSVRCFRPRLWVIGDIRVTQRIAEITSVTAASKRLPGTGAAATENEGWKGLLSSGKPDLQEKMSSQTNFHFLYLWKSIFNVHCWESMISVLRNGQYIYFTLRKKSRKRRACCISWTLNISHFGSGLRSTFPFSPLLTYNLVSNTVTSLNSIHKPVGSVSNFIHFLYIQLPPHFVTCHWSWRNNFAAFVKKKDHFSAPVAICKRKISNLQGKILQSVQLLISAFFFSVNFIQLASLINSFHKYFIHISDYRREQAVWVWDIWLSFSLVSVENTIQSLGIVIPSPAARPN